MQQRRRNGGNGATAGMNHALLRLRTTFVDLGGDFRNATQADAFVALVENRKLTLPARQRWAFELVSAAAGAHPYPKIIARLQRQGVEVNEKTLRRSVERAVSRIEDDIRARRWGREPPPSTAR